ncbi:MAG: hypothetical protein U1F34_01185 [Gammaproteobacteria bacterium]
MTKDLHFWLIALAAFGAQADEANPTCKVITADRVTYKPDAHLHGVAVAVLNGNLAHGVHHAGAF